MTAPAEYYGTDPLNPMRKFVTAFSAAGFIAYTGIAIFATLIFPPAIIVFLAPFGMIAVAFTPRGQSVPQTIIWPLILAAAALMPFWPTYIHVKLGPLPILTPPRIIFYILTLFWIMDMLASPLRRGQFRHALKKNLWLGGLVLGFFLLNAISVPIAEGKKLAGSMFFRMVIILLLPFCIFLTYVRRYAQLKAILMVTTIGAAIAAVIAVIEFGTGTLMAQKLAPLIMGEGAWLEITQELKSRDGKFRSQSTHTHPISLGEYFSFCAPLATAFAIQAKGRARWLWLLALAVMIAGTFATNSRGALISIGAGMGMLTMILIWRTVAKMRGAMVMPLVGLMTVFVVLGSPIAYIGVDKFVSGAEGTSAARSSQSRLDQIELAWPKIVKRPIGGYGAGRSARIVGYYGRALSLDNYYLSLTVELGFPGPICFLAMLIVAMRVSMRRSRDNGFQFANEAERWICIGLAAAFFSFIVSRLIISQTGNLNFLFPILGALIGANANARFLKRSPRATQN